MGNYQSPSVVTLERALDTSVPSLPTSICGMVGDFSWGPCKEIVTVTTDRELVDFFGEPTDTNYKSFFSAFNFLSYGRQLRVVRMVDSTAALNAGLEIADDTEVTATIAKADLILNGEEAEDYSPVYDAAGGMMQFFAKYPGTHGNTFKVAVSTQSDFATAEIVTGGITFAEKFEFAPEVGQIAVAVLNSDDELLETFVGSTDIASLDYQNNRNFISYLINRESSYVLCYFDHLETEEVTSIVATPLAGGVDDAPQAADAIVGFNLYRGQDVSVQMLIDGQWNSELSVQQHMIDNIAEVRRDLVVYLNVPESVVIGVTESPTFEADLTAFYTTLGRSSEYAALYGNFKKQFDRYAQRDRWMPIAADAAGITALTHFTREAWFAPAGYNRGIVKNMKSFAYNPNLSRRDNVWTSNINIAFTDGPDHLILSQKTLQNKPTSFAYLDVRWLFLVIEREIAAASKYFLQEKNTPFTRRQFLGMVVPYLNDIVGREGITFFDVDVSAENVNTDVVVNRGEFRAEFVIRPTRSIKNVILRFNNVGGNVTFEELISA